MEPHRGRDHAAVNACSAFAKGIELVAPWLVRSMRFDGRL